MIVFTSFKIQFKVLFVLHLIIQNQLKTHTLATFTTESIRDSLNCCKQWHFRIHKIAFGFGGFFFSFCLLEPTKVSFSFYLLYPAHTIVHRKSFFSPPDTHIAFKIVLNYATLVFYAFIYGRVLYSSFGICLCGNAQYLQHVVLLLSHNRLLYDNVIVCLTG